MQTTLEQHPLCQLFPDMPEDEFQQLVEDIRQHGVLEPIELYDGMILEGRHRYRAAQEAGVNCPTTEWHNGNGMTPEQYVWSKNGLRRHLTVGQRVALLEKLFPAVWEAAGKEPGKGAGGKGGGRASVREHQGATQRLAETSGLSRDTIERAKRVQEKTPDLWERVQSGEISIYAADKERFAREKAREEEKRQQFSKVYQQAKQKEETRKEQYERQEMELREQFVKELLDRIGSIKDIPKEVRLGLKHEKFAPEAKPFVARRIEQAIGWLMEAKEELE